MGINTGILTNAYPLTSEQIRELERQVLANQESFAYLDENSELCFALPFEPDVIKDLAWNNAYELSAEENSFTKKAYKKTGLKTFSLNKVLSKQNINDSWSGDVAEPTTERLEGDGQEFYTMAPSTLSFRSTAPLNELQDVQINGQTVDPSNYELEEGSTIVKLKHDYLSTLNTGTYELSVVSDSKTVKGDFTVAAPKLTEYGLYYGQPYTGAINDSSGQLWNISIMFAEDGSALVFNMNSRDFTKSEWQQSNGTLTLDMLAYQSVITGNFTSDGLHFIGNQINNGTSVSVEFVLDPEALIADENYFYMIDSSTEYTSYCFMPKDRDIVVFDKHDIKLNLYNKPVTNLAPYAFSDCVNLTRVVIPEGVITMNGSTFVNCINLTEVIIPETVTCLIGTNFDGCSSLKTIEIPSSVTDLGWGTFSRCTELTNISIPDSVTELKSALFSSCTNLKSINIGSGVTKIQSNTFVQCSSLANITFNGTVEQWTAATRMALFWNSEIPATSVQCIDGIANISSGMPSAPQIPS